MTAPIVAALLPELVGALRDVFESAFPDTAKREEKRQEFALKAQEILNQLDVAQMDVNKAEAASPIMFVAGWRPFVGWCCGGAFAYHYILQPFLIFIFAAAGKPVPPLPVFDMDSMMFVLFGMLGLGSMRTWEKGKGLTGGLSGALPWRK